MASAVMDNAKAFANEHLATLRVKLNQIPALQEVEVSLRFVSRSSCRRVPHNARAADSRIVDGSGFDCL